jgi:tRNA/tmRNA/rRNA uracil-C5-methylase (TrmA/RlmC/RlmD family)
MVMSLQVGQEIEVTAGEPAHGGWCVAHPEGEPVVFVRHALPGELVRVVVTEVTSRFARGDAVDVLKASPDRVEPPCRYARPGGCGGCDWQHASLPAQRALKAAVVAQQLRRMAGIDREVVVEELPGGAETSAGLGWRTRMRFAVNSGGAAGLHEHRSHEVVAIDDCLIASPAIRELDIPGQDWTGLTAVEAEAGADAAQTAVILDGRLKGDIGGPAARRSVLERKGRTVRPVRGRPFLRQHAAGRDWRVTAGAFWQVHPGAADALCAAVTEILDAGPGDTVTDLYCGAGLFAGVLAPLTGPDGAVTAVESDPAAVADARDNLRAYNWARVRRGDVAALLRDERVRPARLVVADPPRAGLAREVIDYLDAGAQRFAYVSCDPATLARDIRLLTERGWSLATLRAFDAFPMTHHVECVAGLTR